MSSLGSSSTPILEMPREVIDHIEGSISKPKDRIAFAITCVALRNRYYIPAVFSRLEKHLVYKCSHGKYQNTKLFLLTHARKGEHGRKPFLITSLSLSPDRTDITIGLIEPAFARDVPERPTRSYIFIHTEGKRAEMYSDYTKKLPYLGDGIFVPDRVDVGYWEGVAPVVRRYQSPISRDLKYRTKEVDWRTAMAGRLVPATVKRLRQRFKCVECNGKGSINARGFHRRWPDLGPAPFPFDLSCPRCVGYSCTMQELDDVNTQMLNEDYSDSDEAETFYQHSLHEMYHSELEQAGL